jgi:hypothetical protein
LRDHDVGMLERGAQLSGRRRLAEADEQLVRYVLVLETADGGERRHYGRFRDGMGECNEYNRAVPTRKCSPAMPVRRC